MPLDLTQEGASSQAEANEFREQFVEPLLRLNPAIPTERAELERWIERHRTESVTTTDDSYDFRESFLKLLAQTAQRIINEYDDTQKA